jgi:hypothetical protein
MAGDVLAAYRTVYDFVSAIDLGDEREIAAQLHDNFILNQSLLGTKPGSSSPPAIRGKAAAVRFLMDGVGRLDTACHITNMRTTGESSPSGGTIVKCYAIAHHYRPGEALMPDKEGFVAGSEYICEIRQSKMGFGSWRLSRLSTRPLWCRGDISVFDSADEDE